MTLRSCVRVWMEEGVLPMISSSAAVDSSAMIDPAARIHELAERIRSADYAYYALDAPIVSDAEYDSLMRDLRAAEAEHPDLVEVDSPTRRVPGAAASGFQKVPHLEPLLSL